MSSDAIELVDTTCAVCGTALRGEKVVWREFAEGGGDKDHRDRVAQTFIKKSGGYVCGTCGTTLCAKTHKKEVANANWRGYSKSPCPKCGAPLWDGFILAAPPEGAFEAAEADAHAGADHPAAEGSAPDAPSIGALRWQPQVPVKDDVLALSCPHCQQEHTLGAELLLNPPPEGVAGLTLKPFNVRRAGLVPLVALAIGAAVFIWVHWAMYGPQIQIGIPLLVPAFASVVAYNLSQPLLAAFPLLSGKKVPVYGYTCSACGKEMVFASDGKSVALPVPPATP